MAFWPNPRRALNEILTKNGSTQSFVLKKRLYIEGIKTPKCELCGWAEMSKDGRIPVELDHINGDRYDNRIGNLRILCPNCHSPQSTHRGRNKKTRLKKLTKRRAGVVIGSQG
jgi:HNH endonuclease